MDYPWIATVIRHVPQITSLFAEDTTFSVT
jgi:hypothetical protein